MKFLLQSSYCDGTYRNPFKRGGVGMRFSKWRTVDAFNSFEEAKEAFLNFKLNGMTRRRVSVGGKVVINPEGRVYEVTEIVRGGSSSETRTEKVLYFKEQLQCETF